MAKKKELIKYDSIVVAKIKPTDKNNLKSLDKKKCSIIRKITKFVNKNNNITISKYFDITAQAINENEDLYIYSKLRGVTFILKNAIFEWQHEKNIAKNRIESIFKIIVDADKNYSIKNSNSVNGEYYISLTEDAYHKQCIATDKKETIRQKQECKRKAKSTTKFKYRIGELYGLTMKNIDGKNSFSEVYRVKKFVWSVGNTPVNIVIMKHVGGMIPRRRSISPYDCRAFHIKYENHLYVFSMNTRFTKLSEEIFDKWKSEQNNQNICTN